jgi:hypothetical protein
MFGLSHFELDTGRDRCSEPFVWIVAIVCSVGCARHPPVRAQPPLQSSAELARGAPSPPTRKECPARLDDSFFFPPGTLGPRRARFDEDAFRRQWYSSHLRAMTEPSLSCGNLEGETYRFLWLRTFHPPIAVRLTVTQGTARILSVQLSGAGGYHPGTVVHRTEHLLPPQEWNQVRDAINVAHFWQMGAWEGKPGGLDGAQWAALSMSRTTAVGHAAGLDRGWNVMSNLRSRRGAQPGGYALASLVATLPCSA